jgi:hypothetical protein
MFPDIEFTLFFYFIDAGNSIGVMLACKLTGA